MGIGASAPDKALHLLAGLHLARWLAQWQILGLAFSACWRKAAFPSFAWSSYSPVRTVLCSSCRDRCSSVRCPSSRRPKVTVHCSGFRHIENGNSCWLHHRYSRADTIIKFHSRFLTTRRMSQFSAIQVRSREDSGHLCRRSRTPHLQVDTLHYCPFPEDLPAIFSSPSSCRLDVGAETLELALNKGRGLSSAPGCP
ncbi:uncharacterized protein LY89DRAFT_47021 [Mollisia scopiformis]|uniref:Uncharacterized protein n=1 Tax=Mollisia scopiformis TaxID=149040 RepID=A0A194XDW2_MOLSC|nr:uncharacterized protein LY89DRAFT_47021 [Mollisia scopiformis]KUJ18375.1 hypothetical protein LY89DRAFT_47021 [Mollisia scopiformis]